ncbi:MAG: DNA-protecting protein DprA [Microbacteriaceae bacterium]|nr:DNA-protecting protein DprA [Microbacteriaceae bacterium]
MTFFGIQEAVVAPLIRSLSERELPSSAIAERFARAVFTGITEPGDRVAGVLIDSLGVTTALTAIIQNWPSEQVQEVLAGSSGSAGNFRNANSFGGANNASTTNTASNTGSGALSREEICSAQDRWQPRLNVAGALTALQQAVRFGARLVTPDDPEWPTGVDDLGEYRPIALWLRGNLAALESTRRSIALVGARAATGYGEHITMEASAGLVDRGYTITSGAAYGIDGMAHRAALASSGQTVAFLAGGVDRFYPSGHHALLTRIVADGAVVSELPCGAPPTKWRFLQRNRLIAAASLATVVLEAGWRSGSLNTAGHAAALGRPLGAAPGPVTSAASAGCHRLIRDFDAVCVTSASEMAELAPLRDASLMAGRGVMTENGAAGLRRSDLGGAPSGPLESARTTRVIDALSVRSGRSTENIAARAGLAIAEVQSALGILEIEGRARSGVAGWTLARASS